MKACHGDTGTFTFTILRSDFTLTINLTFNKYLGTIRATTQVVAPNNHKGMGAQWNGFYIAHLRSYNGCAQLKQRSTLLQWMLIAAAGISSNLAQWLQWSLNGLMWTLNFLKVHTIATVSPSWHIISMLAFDTVWLVIMCISTQFQCFSLESTAWATVE
jgi:hypothetical protein